MIHLLKIHDEEKRTNKPSMEEASMLELKPMPLNLKYSFLSDKETLLVTISAELSEENECLLLQVLQRHMKAID